MKQKKLSSFYFLSRVHPIERCSKFRLVEEPIFGSLKLDIWLDGFHLWISSTKKDFSELNPLAKNILDTFLASYAILTNISLSYTRLGWVEVRGSRVREAIIGTIDSKYGLFKPPRKCSANSNLKYAAKITREAIKSVHHRMALKDYKTALSDGGDDAFLFAFRSLESLCRAVIRSGGKVEKAEWKRMHHELGTSDRRIMPLNNVANLVRHGRTTSKKLKKARKNRARYLSIARNIILLEIKRSFPRES